MFKTLRPSTVLQAAPNRFLVTRPAVLNEFYVVGGIPNPTPRSEGKLVVGTTYCAFTGVGFPPVVTALMIVLRPTFAAFRDMGMRVERVDLTGIHNELLVYFTVDRQCEFERGDNLFEFVLLGNALGTDEQPELAAGAAAASPGFTATTAENRRLVETPNQGGGRSTRQAPTSEAQADAAREKAAREWLSGGDGGKVVAEPVAPAADAPVPLALEPSLI